MGTLDNDISLKEVLLDVSRKLDRFLEAHAVLHTDMARRESEVNTVLRHYERWGDKIEALEDWENEVRGQLKLLKWASSGGLVAAAAMILKLIGVPLP